MSIKVTNDGTSRAQSCKATVKLESDSKSWGHYKANFSGYGANEYSAAMSLIQQIDNLIIELQKIKDDAS